MLATDYRDVEAMDAQIDPGATASPGVGPGAYTRKPPRSYAYYRDLVRHAVETDAAPTPDLIKANKMLTAWEAYLRIGEVSSFPVTTQISATDICDARCAFCVYSPHTSTDKIIGVDQFARLDWLKFVERFSPNAGLGEPLAHPQLVQMFEQVRRRAPHIIAFLTTNASQMGEPVAKGIVTNVDRLNISLNATRKDSYESIMSLPWEQTIGNLRRLRELREAAGKTMSVNVSIVVQKHNLDELIEAPALLRSLGIDRLIVIPMSIVKTPIPDRQLLGIEDHISTVPEKANQIFRQLEAECEHQGVTLVSHLPWVNEGAFDENGVAAVKGSNRHVARDVSKEYHYPAFDAREPFCLRPWRVLKVDMDRSTLICNGNFGRLPKFGFPTAREFHRADGMWNHPFLQHVRKTRGTGEQVPFCTLCLTADKRHPEHAQRRKRAMDESRALFRRLDTEWRNDLLAERRNEAPAVVSRDEAVVTPPQPQAPVAAPQDRDTRANFRSLVHARGFIGAGRVLMFGLEHFGFAPFLAEGGESLTLADTSVEAVRRVAQYCRRRGSSVQTATVYPGRPFSFADGHFDRIWVDGASLCAEDADMWWPELARIVSPSGSIFVHRAPALGAFLLAMTNEAEPGQRQKLRAMLQQGLGKQAPVRFMPSRDLLLLLHRHDMAVDRETKLEMDRSTIVPLDLSALDDDDMAAIRRRYVQSDEPLDRARLIEHSVSFAAKRKI